MNFYIIQSNNRYVVICGFFPLALFVRFIHLVCSNSLFSHCSTAFHCMNIPWFSYPCLLWMYLSSFQFGAIIVATANCIFIHVFWWAYVFVSVGYICKIGNLGSKGVQMFRYTSYCSFPTLCTNLIPTSSVPHPWLYLIISLSF